MDVKEKLDKIKTIEAQAAEITKKAKAESLHAIAKAEEEAVGRAKVSREEAVSKVDQDRLLMEKQIEGELHGIERVNEKARQDLRFDKAGLVDLAAKEIVKRIKQGMAG